MMLFILPCYLGVLLLVVTFAYYVADTDDQEQRRIRQGAMLGIALIVWSAIGAWLK
ncbi:MAG: hypothetical protein IJU37_11945 [Desulfovibrio sp.]|nr:hypothetical protein [Desulfovibrio sp.]